MKEAQGVQKISLKYSSIKSLPSVASGGNRCGDLQAMGGSALTSRWWLRQPMLANPQVPSPGFPSEGFSLDRSPCPPGLAGKIRDGPGVLKAVPQPGVEDGRGTISGPQPQAWPLSGCWFLSDSSSAVPVWPPHRPRKGKGVRGEP